MGDERPQLSASDFGKLDHVGTGLWVSLSSEDFQDQQTDLAVGLTSGLRAVEYSFRYEGDTPTPAPCFWRYGGELVEGTTNRGKIFAGDFITVRVYGIESRILIVQAPVGRTLEIYAEYVSGA